MINRAIESKIRDLATKFPVVALLGPRQLGKDYSCKNGI